MTIYNINTLLEIKDMNVMSMDTIIILPRAGKRYHEQSIAAKTCQELQSTAKRCKKLQRAVKSNKEL